MMKASQVHVTALALGLLIGSMGTTSAQVAGHGVGAGPEGGAVIGPEGAGLERGLIEDEGPIPDAVDAGSAMRMGPDEEDEGPIPDAVDAGSAMRMGPDEEPDNQGPPPMRPDEE